MKISIFAAVELKDAEGSVTERLYLLPPDAIAERWTGTRIKPQEAESVSGVKDVRFVGALETDFSALANSGNYGWAPITYAYEKGYAHLEFMDAGLPFKKHGYRDFILRFGGKQSSTRRWFRFSWKWLNKLLCKFYI